VTEVVFTPRARRDWNRLDHSVQSHIRKKLAFFLESGRPLQYAEKLVDSSLGEYRFRIGDYRVIFDLEGDVILVLRVGHRREIYKR